MAPAALLLCAGTCGESLEPDPHGDEAAQRAEWLRLLSPPLDEPTRKRVVELMQDPHDMPRVEAVALLGRGGRKEDWALIRPLLEDPGWGVRREVCKSAALLADPRAVPDLAKVAGRRTENAWVRLQAVQSLEGFGPGKEVVRGLIDVLNDGFVARPRNPDELIGEQTVVHAAHEALRKLTGQEHPAERQAWMAWSKATHGE